MSEEEKRLNEIPNAKWATWGLVKAIRKEMPDMSPLLKWIVDRLETYDIGCGGENVSHKVSYIITANGYWGRGKTVAEAAEACRKSGAPRTFKACLTIVINDETPEVNEAGYLITESDATSRCVGLIGTIGSILNANKDS